MTQYLELLAACQVPLDSGYQQAFLLDYQARQGSSSSSSSLQEENVATPVIFDQREVVEIVPDPTFTRRTGTGRPIHRYDRLYHFRWTLHNLLGLHAGFDFHPSDVGIVQLCLGDRSLHSKEWIYTWVHRILRSYHWQRLYIRIPALIRLLGGPSWDFGGRTTQAVLDAVTYRFRQLDAAFGRRAREVGRHRFPTMKFVAMALLHLEGITPPYKIPWARTAHYSRELGKLVDFLCDAADQAQFPVVTDPRQPLGPNALRALPPRRCQQQSSSCSTPRKKTHSSKTRADRHPDSASSDDRPPVLPAPCMDLERPSRGRDTGPYSTR